jgi:RND family efflux transporter MFP subunit
MLGCMGEGQHSPGEARTTEVSIAQLPESEITDYEEFTGRTEAVETVQIKARVTGYLDKVLFKDGDEVKKGQLLYEIDARPYAAEVKAVNGNIDRTEALLTRAKADLSRGRQLINKGAMAPEDFDKLVATRDEAAATLVANRATLDKAQLNLDFCKVYSPIDGMVSATNITAGNLVNQDVTFLTTVVSLEPIWAYFDVPERTMLRIQQMIREKVSSVGIGLAEKFLRERKEEGAVVEQALSLIRKGVTEANRKQLQTLLAEKLSTADLEKFFQILKQNPHFKGHRETEVPVYLATQLDTGFPSRGHIDFVDNQLNASTGTIRVRGVFPNKDHTLTPRLFVRVRVPLGEPFKATLVAESALASDQSRMFLYVVNDKNEVEYRPVTLGPLRDGLRVIETGVQPGEWVVISGLQRIRPGMTVTTKKVKMPTLPKDVAPAPVAAKP